jgi:hypothetical protein
VPVDREEGDGGRFQRGAQRDEVGRRQVLEGGDDAASSPASGAPAGPKNDLHAQFIGVMAPAL